MITRDVNLKPDGVIVIHDPMMAFDLALEAEEDLEEEDFEMMVIGGGEIFNFFMPYTHKIYLSEVEYSGAADAFFPPIDFEEWAMKRCTPHDNFKHQSSPSFNANESRRSDLVFGQIKYWKQLRFIYNFRLTHK